MTMNAALLPKKTRILIVEDESDIRELMQELLELEGYSVEAACNGQDALDRLHGCADPELPHLILLDVMMPVKDGFAFRVEQELDPRLARIPVVLLSADAHVEEKKMRMGARAALRKPIDFDRFFEVLAEETNQPPG
jgi:CheY-like chemotaxis protein